MIYHSKGHSKLPLLNEYNALNYTAELEYNLIFDRKVLPISFSDLDACFIQEGRRKTRETRIFSRDCTNRERTGDEESGPHSSCSISFSIYS